MVKSLEGVTSIKQMYSKTISPWRAFQDRLVWAQSEPFMRVLVLRGLLALFLWEKPSSLGDRRILEDWPPSLTPGMNKLRAYKGSHWYSVKPEY